MEEVRRCEECGGILDPEDQFCGTCGREIGTSTSMMPEQPQTRLRVIQGSEIGRELTLEGDQMTLGRGQNVELYLEDSGASREHARIDQKNGQFTLTDLESSNGTYLNGVKITGPEALSPGDLITIGDTVMEFQIEIEEGLKREAAKEIPIGGQAMTEGVTQGKKRSSSLLLIGGAALAVVVCLVSAVLVGALVILPILEPDSPTVADNPGSTQVDIDVEFPPVGEDSPFPPSGEDEDFPPIAENPDIPPGMATIEIVNNRSELICFINISPSEEDEWGVNWLEEGEILRPGSTKTFYIEAGFLYDWIVQDCEGTKVVEEYGLSIRDGLNILTIDP
jgi:hypothetical protein